DHAGLSVLVLNAPALFDSPRLVPARPGDEPVDQQFVIFVEARWTLWTDRPVLPPPAPLRSLQGECSPRLLVAAAPAVRLNRSNNEEGGQNGDDLEEDVPGEKRRRHRCPLFVSTLII